MQFHFKPALLAVTLLAVAAPAASEQRTDNDWQFGATLYLWFPGISGTTQFPSGAGGPSINVNAKDVLQKLDMAFMGNVEARRGRWGGLADWVYSDLSSDRAGTRDLSINGQPLGVGVSADVGLEVKTNIVTLAATYTAMESPAHVAALVFGSRLLNTDETLRWSLSGTGPLGLSRSGVAEAGVTNWDAIVGVRGRARLDGDSHWFMPYYLDVGAGASRLTWQAVIGVGYSFDFGDVGLAWRYVDYEFKPTERLQSLTFNGIALGVTFRF